VPNKPRAPKSERPLTAAHAIARRARRLRARVLASLLDDTHLERATRHVDFGVVIGTMAWLSIALTLILFTPAWTAATFVAAAIALGLTLRSRRRLLMAYTVFPTVVMVGVITNLLEDSAEHRYPIRVAGPMFSVGVAMEVDNKTTHSGWRPTIEAAGTDALAFRLRVENRRAQSSPQLFAAIGPDFANSYLQVAIGADATRLYSGFNLAVNGARQNGGDGVGKFLMDVQSITAHNQAGSRPLAQGIQFRPSIDGEPERTVIPIPPIAPREVETIEFNAEYGVPDTPQLSGGGVVRILNTRSPGLRETDVNSASPGDLVKIGGHLDNPGYRPIQVSATFHLQRHEGGRWYSVALLVSSSAGDHERELGRAILNSSTGAPITVVPLPGTTEVKTGRHQGCTSPLRLHLQDGITQKLIEVGDIGGFRPRDPCSGTEFSRWVVFSARVGR
jgi:hypothetical protein